MILNKRDVLQAFLAAMANGWAQDGQQNKSRDPGQPGVKTITFRHGERFLVVDRYVTREGSPQSSGTTTIWELGQPVWVMHYGGFYFDFVVPFLKECLRKAYVDDRCFCGGRGPHFIRGERFTYVNKIELGDFSDFKGEEVIFDLDETLVGFHWYRGMSLTDFASD